jgi:hypothetical protein
VLRLPSLLAATGIALTLVVALAWALTSGEAAGQGVQCNYVPYSQVCPGPPQPVNATPPRVKAPEGGPRVGDVLTATPGVWDDAYKLDYQWHHCIVNFACFPIEGEITPRHVVLPSEEGQRFYVSVTATATKGPYLPRSDGTGVIRTSTRTVSSAQTAPARSITSHLHPVSVPDECADDPAGDACLSRLGVSAACRALPPDTEQCPEDLREQLTDPRSVAVERICPDSVEYVAYWLGAFFDGLPAAEARRACELPDPVLGRNVYLQFSYGSCTAAPSSACVPPVQVQSSPLCERNYRLYRNDYDSDSGTYPSSPISTAHGYSGRSFEGGMVIELYTDVTTISIYGNSPDSVRRAAEQVRTVPTGVKIPRVGAPLALSFSQTMPASPMARASRQAPADPLPPARAVLNSALECTPALDVSASWRDDGTLALPAKNLFETTALTGDVRAEALVPVASGASRAAAPRLRAVDLGVARLHGLRPGRATTLRFGLDGAGARRLRGLKAGIPIRLRFNVVGRLAVGQFARSGSGPVVYRRRDSMTIASRKER